MAEHGRSWQPVSAENGAPTPAGVYSPAIIAGDLIFVSGQVPKDPRTGQMVGGDVATQTRQVLANVEAVLAQAGATLDDVVSVTVYLAHADDWTAFNEAYRAVFRAPYPTRTTVGAELRGILVEISAIAYRRA